MKSILLIGVAMLSASAFATYTYNCDDGSQVVITDSGEFTVPGESGIVPTDGIRFGQPITCLAAGNWGRLFYGSGAGAHWTYRVPTSAFSGVSEIRIQVGVDSDDSDCSAQVLTCHQ